MKLGILGGMGPLATADFFKKIVLMTDASSDQDHIRVLMDDNPQIPDRTAYIMGDGVDPTREMVRSALRLEFMGADFIAMPCNTAHKFHTGIQSFLNVPLLNMVDLTGSYVKRTWPESRKTLLLATKGTYTAGLYNFALNSRSLELVTPDEADRNLLMQWIYKVKSTGQVPAKDAVESLLKRYTGGEDIPVILGCTELPIIFDKLGLEGSFVDTTHVLALECIRLGKEKSSKDTGHEDKPAHMAS